jgi:hypothetical protein
LAVPTTWNVCCYPHDMKYINIHYIYT